MLPPSAATPTAAIATLCGFVAGVAVSRAVAWTPLAEVLLVLALTFGPSALLDTAIHRVWRRPSTELVAGQRRDPARIATKAAGTVASLAAIGFLYWLFPEYHGAFYDPFRELLTWGLLPWLVATLVAHAWLDGVLAEPRTGPWHLGASLLRLTGADRAQALDQLREWLARGFFAPLLFVYLGRLLGNLDSALAAPATDPVSWFFELAFVVAFAFEGFVHAAGWLVALRLTDTHVRRTDPSLRAWVVTLVCYEPFWSLMGRYLAYESGQSWGTWLEPWPAAKLAWGLLILGALTIEVWGAATLGLRYTPLTARGVVTSGPYRFVKHPIYLATVVRFFLVSVPFAGDAGLVAAVRDLGALGALATVYWLRAKAEEAHLLATEPAYAAYARALARR